MPKEKKQLKGGANPSEIWKERKGGIKQKSEDLEELKVALTDEKKTQTTDNVEEEIDEFVDELEELEEHTYNVEEDDELNIANFSTLWAERRKCYVPITGIDGNIVHVPIHSLTDKERSDIMNDKRCVSYHYNKKTRQKEVKEYNQNMVTLLMVWAALDDDFKNTIKGSDGADITEEEKVAIFFENIPMGDLVFLQEAIQKISGIDVENIELIKKDFGLLAFHKKTLLQSLLNIS